MLKYLPLILFCIVHLTLIITFSIAICLHHITYFVPYISDSGTYPPESCIFGLMLNLIAVLIAITMYIRFLQVREILKAHNYPIRHHQINKVSFIIGIFACFGLCIVANFQETAMLIIHWFGAILLFALGALYQCCQTFIYSQLYHILEDKHLNVLRKVLAVVSSISVLIFISTGLTAGSIFKGEDVTKWKKEDEGFELHIISTVSEWICASCTMSYLLCFMSDFKKITLNEPEIFIVDDIAVSLAEVTF